MPYNRKLSEEVGASLKEGFYIKTKADILDDIETLLTRHGKHYTEALGAIVGVREWLGAGEIRVFTNLKGTKCYWLHNPETNRYNVMSNFKKQRILDIYNNLAAYYDVTTIEVDNE